MFKYVFIIVVFFFSCHSEKKWKVIDESKESSILTKKEANDLKKKLYEIFKSSIKSKRKDEIIDQSIKIDDRKLKYDLKYFGTKPQEGWELYLSLHGGGGVPHSSNENSWVRHKTLYKLNNGILLTPRSPTNTWNMWHQEHIDIFFNRLIQNMIIFYDVDPNKIYLMGYSAGGDGVYQLAPRMADRFAAAAMMAGHPNDASPLGLRNIGFTIHMGENDSAYNRNLVAAEWNKKLQVLVENDKGGYANTVEIHKGKGHWMDGLDNSAISWISNFIRNPFPEKVVWKQDDVTHNRFYWLKVIKPSKDALIIASIANQTITIEESSVDEFIIMLNDDLINMDNKIKVVFGGKVLHNTLVLRDPSVIERSINEYGDPESIYFGEVLITLNQKTK